MPIFSHGTDRVVTFVVRFICGAIVGCFISVLFGFSTTMRLFAESAWLTLLLRLLLWGGIVGLIFGLMSAKNDHKWLE